MGPKPSSPFPNAKHTREVSQHRVGGKRSAHRPLGAHNYTGSWRGNNSSMRLFGLAGSFSRVSVIPCWRAPEGTARRSFFRRSIPSNAPPPPRRTTSAPILPDHRQVPALTTQLACGRLGGGAAGCEWRRRSADFRGACFSQVRKCFRAARKRHRLGKSRAGCGFMQIDITYLLGGVAGDMLGHGSKPAPSQSFVPLDFLSFGLRRNDGFALESRHHASRPIPRPLAQRWWLRACQLPAFHRRHLRAS
jgi:hypothetical protein